MGGKGVRRREKNYLAAHGGHSRLPPPPNPSQVDALPSKLRKIMLFSSNNTFNSIPLKAKPPAYNKLPPEDRIASEAKADVPSVDDDKEAVNIRTEKVKKKTKRKQVQDLRFEASMENTKSSQRKRERRKMYLEAKKNKRKTPETEKALDFPGREQIEFGDIVQAPPRLVAPSKVFKNVPGASQERVRLQAIDAYRKRKAWTSRPGLQLPDVKAAPSL